MKKIERDKCERFSVEFIDALKVLSTKEFLPRVKEVITLKDRESAQELFASVCAEAKIPEHLVAPLRQVILGKPQVFQWGFP